MSRIFFTLLVAPLSVAAIASLVGVNQTSAATVMAARSSDNVLQANFEADAAALPTFTTNNSNARRLGTGGAGGQQRMNAPVLGFTLPMIPIGETIGSAVFSVTSDSGGVTGSPLLFDGVVSLLGAASTGDISGADYIEVPGPTGLGAGNAFVATFTEADVTAGAATNFTITGDALTQLNGLYDLTGAPSQAEVFFRLTPSAFVDTTNAVNDNDRLLNLERDTIDGPNLVTRSLTFETVSAVPEPSSLAILGLVGLGAIVRRRNR